MIKTHIISVGKIKEKAVNDIISEYEKRLNKYTDFSAVVVDDLSLPQNPNDGEIEKVLAKEAASIIKAIPKNAVKIALTITGKQYTSTEFADFISSRGSFCYIIGSSHGLHSSVVKMCDYELSLSKMTFPHNLARLFLAEQIYRSFKILNNENYHK